MNARHQVHNLIILDESGSMESIRKYIINGFNELVQTIKGIEKEYPDQEHFISLISFNGLGQKILHFLDPVSKLELINDRRYNPSSSTPLYDNMGYAFAKLRKALENQSAYNVLVTILTDGEENASKEFTGYAIKKLVEELVGNNWTFTYIGADHNVEAYASDLSILNTMVFEKDEASLNNMFLKEQTARAKYSRRIREKKDVGSNYYDPEP